MGTEVELWLQRCEEKVRAARGIATVAGSTRAETALGQNALRVSHRPHVELCTLGPGSSSKSAEPLGCFPFLPIRETQLLSQDIQEEKLRGLQAFPKAHSEQNLRRIAR